MTKKTNSFVKQIIHLILFFVCTIPLSTKAQNIGLNGSVVDIAGDPIIGASVVENGSTNGTITNFDGEFSLSVPSHASITISYIGFETQTVPVNGRSQIKVTLKEDNEMLDEVVVIGYGTMKKSDMTGAISSVDVEDLSKRSTTNPAVPNSIATQTL